MIDVSRPKDKHSYYDNTRWCNRDLIPMPPERRTWGIWGYCGRWTQMWFGRAYMLTCFRILDCLWILYLGMVDGKHTACLWAQPTTSHWRRGISLPQNEIKIQHAHKRVRSWEVFSQVFWPWPVAGWVRTIILASPCRPASPGACREVTFQSCFVFSWRKLPLPAPPSQGYLQVNRSFFAAIPDE